MAKYDVFISYSRKDSAIVKFVANKLRSEGLSVWIDEDGIESGDLFKKVITTAIENSACLLFFSSESSNNSAWTAKEIGIAIYEKIPVIPVILDDAKYNPEIKFDLVNLDFVDMRAEQFREKSIARIVKSIKKFHQNTDNETSVLNTFDETEKGQVFNSDKKQNNTTSSDSRESSTNYNQSYHEPLASKEKGTNKLSAFLHRAFFYPIIQITLFLILFFFGGIIGLILYPFILIIYYEIRNRKGLVIPAFYIKWRNSILIIMGFIIAALIWLGGFLVYDTYKSENQVAVSVPEDQISETIMVINVDSILSNNEDMEQNSVYNPKGDESSELIKMTGKLANKEMTLYLLPSDGNRIAVELDIDGTKYSPAFTPFLNRRTLNVDLDDANGTFIGGLEGIITIKNGVITYKGRAHSQGNTSLFKDGNFEFHGNANDAIIEMIPH